MEVGSDEGSSMPRRRGGNRDRHSSSRIWIILEEGMSCCSTEDGNRFGFGWDESQNMVTVEDNAVWDDYVKMDPSAKGMRHQTWPFLTAWREIFRRDCATGERSADPFNDITNEEIAEMQECNVREDKCVPEPYDIGLEDEPVSSFNANVDPTQNSSSAAKRTGGSSSRKAIRAMSMMVSQDWLKW
ncbi:UNVERIFIED_CONTAM: hypothetical protein Sindi_2680900 [Sesamum indicum]